VKGELESYVLYQIITFPMILRDPNHPIFTFCVFLHISGKAEASLQILYTPMQ